MDIGIAVLKVLTSTMALLPIYAHDGVPLGLMDSSGRELIAAKYSEGRYLGRGLYLMRNVKAGLEAGDKLFLFNRDGKPLQVNVPVGAEFAGVYSFGSPPSTTEKTTLSELPKKSIVIFSKLGNFGLCNLSGKEVLPARFGAIDNVHDGCSLIFENYVRYYPAQYLGGESSVQAAVPTKSTDRAFIFDGEDGSLKPLEQKGIDSISAEYSDGLRSFSCVGKPPLWGYLDRSGKVAIKPQFESAGSFADGTALVSTFGKEKQLGAHLCAINKSGRIVHTGDSVLGRRWNGFYIATSLRKQAATGVVNGKFEWVLKPEFSLVQARRDGSYLACKLSESKVSTYSQDGQQAETTSFSELDRTRLLFRYVQKSKYNPLIVRQLEGKIFSAQYAFDEPGKMEITANSLVTNFSPYVPLGFDSQLNTPVSSVLAAQVYPRVVEAQAEPDRFFMRHARGTYFFDSTRWTEMGSNGWAPLPPSKSFLSDRYGAKLDLFSRFLHEHNLIGMRRDEVLRLLGPGDATTNDNSILRYMILFGGCCADSSLYVDINLVNNSVGSWNFFAGDGKKSAEIKENVVLVPEIVRM